MGFIWRNAFLGQTLSFAPEKKESARGKALTGCPSVRGAESGPAARCLPPSTAARAGADLPNGYRAPGFPGPHSRGQSESPRWQVGYEFPAAAVANYHKLGVLKTRNVFSHSPGSQKSKVSRATLSPKALGRFSLASFFQLLAVAGGPWLATLPAIIVAGLLPGGLRASSSVFCLCVFSSYKGLSLIRFRAHPTPA